MWSCTFFGHRDCPESVKPALKEAVELLIERHGVLHFYVGNQGRFDACVRAVLSALQKKHPDICFSVVLAYHPAQSSESEAGVDTVYPEGMERVPLRYAIDRRNLWMLSQSDFVISYVRHSIGGAARYVHLAERQKKKIIYL